MLLSVYDFLTQLSMVYLLTAMFVILDLLLLTTRAHRLRREKAEREERESRRIGEAEQERRAFERRREYLQAAPQAGTT